MILRCCQRLESYKLPYSFSPVLNPEGTRPGSLSLVVPATGPLIKESRGQGSVVLSHKTVVAAPLQAGFRNTV